jgi:hypothetical protein
VTGSYAEISLRRNPDHRHPCRGDWHTSGRRHGWCGTCRTHGVAVLVVDVRTVFLGLDPFFLFSRSRFSAFVFRASSAFALAAALALAAFFTAFNFAALTTAAFERIRLDTD